MMDAITRERLLSPPDKRVDAVLDTDAYNEIDDQFAIAYFLKNPQRINPLAIFAAPFLNERSTSAEDGMEKSYDEILKLLTLCGRQDMIPTVYRGSRSFLPDEKTPVSSPAAEELIRLSQGYSAENPLYVVAIGAITNIASALL